MTDRPHLVVFPRGLGLGLFKGRDNARTLREAIDTASRTADKGEL